MKKRKRGNFMAVHDIVIFGNGMHAVFAACKAASEAPAKSVALIVPDVSGKLGGLASVGGQNYCDVSPWNGQVVTKGSFNWYLNKAESDPYYTGRGYNTDDLASSFGSLRQTTAICIFTTRATSSIIHTIHLYFVSQALRFVQLREILQGLSSGTAQLRRKSKAECLWMRRMTERSPV